MTDNDEPARWKRNIEAWRKLSPEERKRRHLEVIPRHVRNSMAMEGEVIDEEALRRGLERKTSK